MATMLETSDTRTQISSRLHENHVGLDLSDLLKSMTSTKNGLMTVFVKVIIADCNQSTLSMKWTIRQSVQNAVVKPRNKYLWIYIKIKLYKSFDTSVFNKLTILKINCLNEFSLDSYSRFISFSKCIFTIASNGYSSNYNYKCVNVFDCFPEVDHLQLLS